MLPGEKELRLGILREKKSEPLATRFPRVRKILELLPLCEPRLQLSDVPDFQLVGLLMVVPIEPALDVKVKSKRPKSLPKNVISDRALVLAALLDQTTDIAG
jgi:hypothetical protein